MTAGVWIWWVLGQAVGGAGAVVLAWALLADRLRGGHRARRCPRCWYDLAGSSSLTCPECNHTARREARLYRARVRPLAASFGIVLLAAGLATVAYPSVRREGWVRLLPIRIQARVWPLAGQPLGIIDAAHQGRISDSEARAIVEGCRGVLRAGGDAATRGQALDILELLPTWAAPAEPELMQTLNDADPSLRAHAAELLGQMADPNGSVAAALIRQATTDKDDRAHRRALETLFGRARVDERFIPVVASIVDSDNRRAAEDAAEMLAHLGPGGIAQLTARLSSRSAAIRERAAEALEHASITHVAAAVPALVKALADPDRSVASAAATTLERMRIPVAAEVAAAIPGASPEVKDRALSVLNRSSIDPDSRTGAEIAKIAVPLLGDPNARVWSEARNLLEDLPGAEAELVAALSDPSPEVRQRACRVLGRRSRPVAEVALEPLGVLASDPAQPEPVRKAAAEARDNIQRRLHRR